MQDNLPTGRRLPALTKHQKETFLAYLRDGAKRDEAKSLVEATEAQIKHALREDREFEQNYKLAMRGSRITTIDKVKFLENLRLTGNITQSAKRAGRSAKVMKDLRERDPVFRDEYDAALDEAVDMLEGEARRRAVEGWEEPIFQRGEQIGLIRKYSDKLMETLLRGARPEKYGRDTGHRAANIVVNIDLSDRSGSATKGVTIDAEAEKISIEQGGENGKED